METTRFRGRTTFEESSLSSNYELPSHSYDSAKKSSSHQRRGRKEDPSPWTLPAVILFILVVFGFIRYVDFRLPQPLSAADVQNNPNSFIEERAKNDLIILTSTGPRVAGSHVNDITTIDTLTRIMKEIQRTKLNIYEIEYEVQKPVGSFHMAFQDGLTSSYSNIPNFVVKLSPVNRQVNDSILVNCHFDSVPGSPGASDDMISCAVMLEVIRVLSRNPVPLANTIVFLFNGAEENLLQGAHGFIKGRVAGSGGGEIGHRWTKDLKCFINLESAGAGAREILFQTGPGNGWLVESYNKVPYPWGSVVGEEIFQNGLIPSDTDFRIFRDYAKIPGLDMAFVKNGYFYHTKFDDVDHVTAGSLQHEGSNVLALLESLGNVDFSKTEFSDSKMVFFDVFGYFMVSYSANAAVIFNLAIGILVLVIAWIEVDRKISTMVWHILYTFSAWIAGMGASVILGLLLNYFKIFSPFHSYPMSAFLIFGIPCLVAQVLVYSWCLKGQEDFTWIAAKTTLAFCLILTTFFTRIVFSVTCNLVFGMIGLFVTRILFKGVSPVSVGYKLRLGFYLMIGEAFPLALSLYLVAGCLDTFVPIMGRSGSETDPNLFLALLTSFTLTLPTVTGIVPIFVFLKKTFLRASAFIMVALVLIMIFAIGRVPYTDNTPMRVHLIEVDRSYYEADLTTVKKRDAGFWMFNVDPNIPNFYEEMGEKIPELLHKNHVEIDAYNCEDLYCGLPFIFPVKKLIRRSHLIPKQVSLPESMTSRIRMEITQNDLLANNIRRVTFSFVGPDHITINFSPGENYDVDKWTLTNEVPQPMSVLWKKRPTYFVYHARGISFERFNVTIDFKKRAESNPESTDPLVDINYSSFYLHGEEMKSQDMKDFINRLPSWTYVLGFTGVSHVYSVPE